jgi:hypothetical protein
MNHETHENEKTRPTRNTRKAGLFRVFHGFMLFVGLTLLTVATTACGDDPPAPGPTTPTVTRTTETFSGSVQVAGAAFHSFRVAQTGTTEVTLTAASPPATVVMGLAIGTVDDAGCTRLTGASLNTAAGSVPQLAGLTSTGTLCVQVRDVGNQTAPVNYSVSVTHP